MKILVPVWFVLLAAAGLTALAAQPSRNFTPELVGRIPAEPDVVLEWNAAISDHFEEFSLASTPHIQARVYALAHLAIRDAVVTALREARREAAEAAAKSAASAAAHAILVALCPAGVNRFAALQSRQVAAIVNDGAATQGRQIGQRIATSVLSSRAGDGWPVALTRLNTGNGSRPARGKTAKPVPFVLKRPHQFAPEPPFFEYNNGVVMPNRRLQEKSLIGTPADVELTARTTTAWSTEPVLEWNRAIRLLAVQQPQDLPARARWFAALNTTLADALLSATYWNDAYRNDRGDASSQGAWAAYREAMEAGDMLPDSSRLSWITKALSGFPPTQAVLAGAAETILRSSLDDAVLIDLRLLARQCAWTALVNGESTFEGCVAGYKLGSQIAGYVLKQDRR